jgi:SP family arabinose:H+ symporter-like MFS transporter
VLPAMLFLVCSFLIPESPRWLAINQQSEKARQIFSCLMDPQSVEREMNQIVAASGDEQGRFSELFGSAYRRPLIIAVGLAIFAQFSGINAIMYYAPEIFKSTGGSSDAAFASAVWVGVINLLFTFVAIAFVDRAGRRPLLAIGAAVQTIALAAVGIMFARGQSGAAVLICILGFVAAFAMAMGPIPWILISEIFPGRIRGRASSVGVFAIWVACFVVAQTFPSLLNSLGSARTFWIYGGCSLASLIFVLALIPETKGKTLEEIEAFWRDSQPRSVAFEVIPDKN